MPLRAVKTKPFDRSARPLDRRASAHATIPVFAKPTQFGLGAPTLRSLLACETHTEVDCANPYQTILGSDKTNPICISANYQTLRRANSANQLGRPRPNFRSFAEPTAAVLVRRVDPTSAEAHEGYAIQCLPFLAFTPHLLTTPACVQAQSQTPSSHAKPAVCQLD